MKILLLMSSGFDTPGPSRHLYNALITDLTAAGHSVHLIESHSTGADEDCPPSLRANGNFTYETVSIAPVPKKAFAKRYLTGVLYCFKVRKALRRQRQADVVMVQSCPWAPFAVTFAKRLTKAPVVYNSQDMFPGSSIANGAMPQKWMQKVFYAFQKIAYRRADCITVISEDMKRKVIEQGVDAESIRVIVDWYDDQAVREIPWEENKFVQKYQLSKDCFYVQFAGTMGLNFDYRLVADVAERLKDQTDIVFHMIGQGSQKADFEAAVQARGLQNVVFLPLEPQEMVPHVYSACNVCLIPLPRGVIGNSVPSKAGLLMACRRVIVTSADADSEYYEMFSREQIGVACDCGDAKGLADAIVYLRNHPAEREQLAENAQRYGKTNYARALNTARYESLYRELAKESN